VPYVQYVCLSRPGRADRALPYSAVAVTTDQSFEQSQAAVRSAPGLYKDPVRTAL
jgi:hypothetical protein